MLVFGKVIQTLTILNKSWSNFRFM